MDGVHDLGGREGFGPVDVEAPPFRHQWEKRAWAIAQTAILPYGGNIDAWRHTIELMPPAAYLSVPYFEKWTLQRLAILARDAGIPVDDIVARTTGPGPGAPDPAEVAARAEGIETAVQARGASFETVDQALPVFAVGDRVRTMAHGHSGHTRLPGFARNAAGVITAHHGAHFYPDLCAEGEETGRHLYTVEIMAPELWGEAADPRDSVLLDLWEPYLVPA